MYCPNCGKELNDNENFCSSCGYQINKNFSSQNTEVDKSEVGYNILSFFFPLVGLIFFIVWNDKFPIRAKNCGKWALIAVVVEVIIGVLAIILFGILFESIFFVHLDNLLKVL